MSKHRVALKEHAGNESLADTLAQVRAQTESLCRPLATEDYVIQSMPDVSPPKWHLAHTSWFFETFVLRPFAPTYRVFDPAYEQLFNSYYQAIGEPYPRHRRGLLSRPTVEQIYRYRAHIDRAMATLLANAPATQRDTIHARTILGMHHEQQHQELLLTDIKHILSLNVDVPAYAAASPVADVAADLEWKEFTGGVHEIGASGDEFVFDNETPRHRVFLADFAMATRVITNGEYLAFMDAGGYDEPNYWLADGWNEVRTNEWRAPLYWERRTDGWWHYTLNGWRRVVAGEPVCHVSYYEADAYARWAGARLATEAEWEIVARSHAIAGNFVESQHFHPVSSGSASGVAQLYGDVWEWTQSDYAPYPGYRALTGALGEYNGKFMANQRVLRGGSCATPASHIRATYRNFFYPNTRWQFSGIRLVRDR